MDSIRTARRLPSPKAPRQWAAFALPWAVRTQFCSARLVRASKEEQCFAQGKALPKTRRPQDRAEKGLRSSLSFPPCAHQRRENASHMAKRFQKRAGHRPDGRKVCENRFPFHRQMPNGRARSPSGPPKTKGAAFLPRPSCVPLAFAFGYSSTTYSTTGV